LHRLSSNHYKLSRYLNARLFYSDRRFIPFNCFGLDSWYVLHI